MSQKAQLKEETKKQVRALLLSVPRGLTSGEIQNDYRSMVGLQLPFRQLGFNAAEDLFRAMPDVCSMDWYQGELILRGIADESTKHIQKLVSRQKVAPRKRPRIVSTRHFRAPPIRHSVPASIQYKIKQLLQYYPNGLHSADFNSAFSGRYGTNIVSNRLGFNTLTDVLLAIPKSVIQIQHLPVGGFLLHLPRDTTAPEQRLSSGGSGDTEVVKVSHQDLVKSAVKEINTTANTSQDHDVFQDEDSSISNELKTQIKQVLGTKPMGVWAARLPFEYKSQFGTELLYQELGYPSVIEFVAAIPEIVTILRPNPKGDWMLYDAAKMKQVPNSATGQSVQKTKHKGLTEDEIETICQVLMSEPDGILTGEFLNKYWELVGRELNIYALGFDSLNKLLFAMTDCVQIEYTGSGKIKLRTKVQSPRRDKLLNLRLKEDASEKMAPSSGRSVPQDAVGPGACYSNVKLPSNLENYIAIFVSHIEDPGHFWVQLKGVHTTEALEYLMDKLDEIYSGPTGDRYEMPDSLVSVGQVCIAVFPEDDNWHRTVISTIKDDKFVEVFYVDYGSKCCVPRSCLRMIRSKLMRLPAQAYRARLANVKPVSKDGEWSKASRDCLMRLCANKPVVALITSVQDDLLSVCMCDTTSSHDIHINDTMIAEGHCYLYPDNLETLKAPSEDTKILNLTTENLKMHAGEEDILGSTSNEDDYGPHNVQRIEVADGCLIHVILWEMEPYLTSAEISHLIWDSDVLRSRIRQRGLSVNAIILNQEENVEMFEEFMREGIGGIMDKDKLRPFLTIYKLHSVLEILAEFGCKYAGVSEGIKIYMEKFDPNSSYWQGKEEDDSEDISSDSDRELNLEDLELTLQALQYKRKRILQNMIQENYGMEGVDEMNNVELQIADIKTRISQLDEKEVNRSRPRKLSEEEQYITDCVGKQYEGYTGNKVNSNEAKNVKTQLVKPRLSTNNNSPLPVLAQPSVLDTPVTSPSVTSVTSQSSDFMTLQQQQVLYRQMMGVSPMTPVSPMSPTSQLPGLNTSNILPALMSPIPGLGPMPALTPEQMNWMLQQQAAILQLQGSLGVGRGQLQGMYGMNPFFNSGHMDVQGNTDITSSLSLLGLGRGKPSTREHEQ